jgi:hypothetical protein
VVVLDRSAHGKTTPTYKEGIFRSITDGTTIIPIGKTFVMTAYWQPERGVNRPMAKRFTTIQQWAAESNLPKRHKQCLLWILATEDPEKSNAPTLAILAMAGQLGATKAELSEVLGVDVYDKLMSLRAQGAIERGTGGTYVLKANSSLLASTDVVKRHLTPKTKGTHKKPKRTIKKAKIRKTSVQIKKLHNARARTRAASLGSQDRPVRSRSSRSDLDHMDMIDVSTTGVEKYRPKKKKRKSYTQTPSANPKFGEWRPRNPVKWGHMECAGYWLHKYLEFYEIEDQQFVGTSAKGQKELAWSIWNFVKHDFGLRNESADWKEYLDWLFDVFFPQAKWIEDHPVALQKISRLPNGQSNYFLQQFRSRKAKIPKRKKKTRVKYERHPWGYKRIEKEID